MTTNTEVGTSVEGREGIAALRQNLRPARELSFLSAIALPEHRTGLDCSQRIDIAPQTAAKHLLHRA